MDAKRELSIVPNPAGASRLQWVRSRPLAQPFGPAACGGIPFAFSQKAQVLRPVEDRTKVWLHRSADAAGLLS